MPDELKLEFQTHCSVERSPLQTHDRKHKKHFPQLQNNSEKLRNATRKNEPEDRMRSGMKPIVFKERRHVQPNKYIDYNITHHE